jgi:hypothetical protein
MTQLWLVPVDEPSFQQTLAQPVDLSEQSAKPDSFPDRTRVWGVRTDPERGGGGERNMRALEQIETGDPLVIYRNQTSRYHAIGRVSEFWHTTHVRDVYWDGGPALDVFAVEDYQTIDIENEDLNSMLGYKTEFYPQGLWRVADGRPTEKVVRSLPF